MLFFSNGKVARFLLTMMLETFYLDIAQANRVLVDAVDVCQDSDEPTRKKKEILAHIHQGLQCSLEQTTGRYYQSDEISVYRSR